MLCSGGDGDHVTDDAVALHNLHYLGNAWQLYSDVTLHDEEDLSTTPLCATVA